jgi:ribosomal protein L37AE/L43A
MSFSELEKAFSTEEACRNYLACHRWPSGEVSCPRCGNKGVYHLSKSGLWQCHECTSDGYRFSVVDGTIFENTNQSLRDWFRVIHKILTATKRVSALQIHREMGVGGYGTAWNMCRRVRVGLAHEDFRKLMGIVGEPHIGSDDDNWRSRNRMGKSDYAHRQRLADAIHTNTMGGFWSLFKRSIVSGFH